MAIDIAGGVRQRLADDGALTAMLAEYGAAPAIFVDPVPADFTYSLAPAVVISEPVSDIDESDFSEARRSATCRVRLYCKPNGGDTAALRIASERVRALLRLWSSPSFSTGRLMAATVSGPTPAPVDDPAVEGRALSVTLAIKE